MIQPIFLLILWAIIKWYRGSRWGWVDLSQSDRVFEIVERLDDLRSRNTALEEEPNAWYNLWGWFERRDQRKVSN